MIVDNSSASNGSTPFGHSLSKEFAIGISFYFVGLIVTAVIFNSLLIYTIVQNRVLHSSTNYLIINLAICDLITAVTTLPLETDFLLRGNYRLGLFVCGLKETVFMFSLPSAIANLLLLTVDRFVLIVFPHKHKKIFTRRNLVIIILITWSYTLIVGLFPLMYDHDATHVEMGYCYILFPFPYTMYQLVVNFTFPLIAILFMNVFIYRVAKRYGRRKIPNTAKSPSKRKSLIKFTATNSANFKAAIIIMVLVGVCLFCWLTYIVIVMSNILCRSCYPREVTWTGNAINYSSIALNPILYGLLNKKIRTVLLKKHLHCYAKPNHEEFSLVRASNTCQFE